MVKAEALHRPRLAMKAVRELVVVHLGHLAEEAVRSYDSGCKAPVASCRR